MRRGIGGLTWEEGRERDAGAKSAPKGKWGRHCCRPHSHQRVGILLCSPVRRTFPVCSPRHTWRPMSHALQFRVRGHVFSEPRHRRSHRHPTFACIALTSVLGPKSLPIAQLRFSSAEALVSCQRSQTVACKLPCMPPRSLARSESIHHGMASHIPQTIRLASDRSLLHALSQDPRGQPPQRPLVLKVFVNQHLAMLHLEAFSSEDMMRLRLDSDLRKAGKSDFSTFPPISCGEPWTTQRFVAFDTRRLQECADPRFGLSIVLKVTLCESCVARIRRFHDPRATRT